MSETTRAWPQLHVAFNGGRMYAHARAWDIATARRGGDRRAGDRAALIARSDLGRQIAVDFEADADLDKCRSRPRH
jgi:hypothetical protein